MLRPTRRADFRRTLHVQEEIAMLLESFGALAFAGAEVLLERALQSLKAREPARNPAPEYADLGMFFHAKLRILSPDGAD